MNNRLFPPTVVFLALTSGATIAIGGGQGDPAASVFESPIRLKVNDKIIDTGPAFGHSSPCVEDLDGDGIEELIVGNFGGKFRYYRNVGTEKQPAYKAGGRVQAGGVDAEVRIYCCIGGQARFCDLDGDGIRDMLANSYDPGHCYLFRGLPGNKFAAREELRDTADVPIRSAPVQQQNHQSFGSFFAPVDWEGDGDFDLLIGCFQGELKLRLNEGTAKGPEFAEENVEVKAAGKPLKVDGHLCPVVADWDDDGLWDILAGCDDGSVTWFRNVGSKKSPRFDGGEKLVGEHDGNGYNRVIWSDDDIVPAIRSQIEVTDHNGDGKLDLLLGDFYTAYDFKPSLSDEQKQEAEELIAQSEKIGSEFTEKLEALRADFKQRYPGDEIYSDKAGKEWREAYQALQESPEAKRMEEHEKEFVQNLRPFLADTRGSGDRAFDLAKPHGHVWLFTRK